MIERLKWDSDFFGFGIGKADLNDILHVFPKPFINDLGKSGFRLLYIFINTEDRPEIDKCKISRLLGEMKAWHVDTKLVYGMELKPGLITGISEKIREYKEKQPNDQLYSLALQSGLYSRYRLDRNFPEGSFERMYKQWMDNSINGIMAQKVFASYDANFINGMVTLSLKTQIATIGLIAVDELARGQKVGKMLMGAVIAEAANSGKKYLTVATQKNNIAASEFYRKIGFNLQSETEIYHLWI